MLPVWLRRSTSPPPARVDPRAREWSLLLANGPVVLLASGAIAAGQAEPLALFPAALAVLASVWFACLALHGFLRLLRFDGDPLFLPLVSLLFLVGTAYHTDVPSLQPGRFSPSSYTVAVWIGLGALGAIVALGSGFGRISRWFEERVWWRVCGDRPYYPSIPFHILLIGLMCLLGVLLLFGGVEKDGGALIQVPVGFGFTITPSEFIRLAVAYFLADYLGRNSQLLRGLREPIGRVWPFNRVFLEPRVELTVVVVTVGLYLGFFYLFKDFGPAAVIVVLTLLALYAATGRVLTPLLLGAGLTGAVGFFTWQHIAFHTFGRRVSMWLEPWEATFYHGDHLARILWAIASGGWFGMGVGTERLGARLPLAHNDAAFAGVAATMGLWTGLCVLALFAALTWRGMAVARAAPTDRMRLLALCLTLLLGFQALWICGAMVRVFPFTGINLPFISTGLSSMIASTIALGTLWNLSRTASARPDATAASPEVERAVTRVGRWFPATFLAPAVGLVLYGCPWLLGNATLTQDVSVPTRAGGRERFQNPYLEAFRARFPRGRIFSADNRLLAVSQPSEQDLRAVAELSPELAADARHRRLRPGERIYPADAVTAHLVGWKSEGRFLELPGSVERDADDLLRGYEPGDLPFYFRVRHNPFVRPPVRQDVQLTIRHDLQKFAVSRMGRAVRGARAAGGALVVYDVTTGDVLAAVTLPTIDPNGMTRKRMAGYQAEHGRTSVLVNKALSREAIYYPGSVFKLFTAGVGLDQQVEGVVECLEGRNRERLSWDTPRGRRRRQANRIRDYRLGTHGPLRLDDGLEYAFTVSCNVFFAGLAAQIGPAAFQSALEEAELELESKAQLEEYLPEAGFGQIAVKYSPIAMAMLAGAVGAAVGEEPESGTARPAWVRAVLRGEKDLRTPENIPGAPDATPYAPFQPETRRALRSLMVQVVENPLGTAYGAFHSPEGQVRLPGITVGGKTGTAEFERALAVRGSRKGRHAWFVGFARSDQEAQPRTIAFAVLLEDVRATVTGGNSCAPVARDLIQQILQAGPIGQNDSAAFPELERLYRERVRTGLGPLAPLVDWLKQRLQRR